MHSLTTTFWDDLLEYIEERRVIPIIGPELLSVRVNDQPAPLHAWLAGRLGQKLNVDAGEIPAEGALNHVICRYLQGGGRREEIYPRLRSIMKEAPLAVPLPLKQLASIHDFTLFVSTTFDSLLEEAINQERFAGSSKTQSIIYSPNNVQDLPCEMRKLQAPTVFHLLGRLSATPDYVITEEDTLEFLTAMQSEKRRPELLFDELKNNHLLLIGCAFPDWLARFFIRLTKGGRLSGQRDWQEIVADQTARKDPNLVLFLQNFSYHTRVFAEGNAVEFVDELSRRYAERHPAEARRGKPDAGAPVSAETEMPAGAVFLSYAIEDLPVVQRLRDALTAAGVQVWFDKRELEAGDMYDAKIRRNIKACSLFLPIVSAKTQARLEGYFRLEWRLAAERAMQIAETVPFILPIAIDATGEGDALVPDAFLKSQWSRLTGGEVAPEFAARLIRLVRDYHKRARGPA